MDCRKIQKLIPLYHDAELEESESQMVREHIEECTDCQNETVLFEKSWDLLSEWEDIEPEPGYISRFRERLSSERTWHEQLFLHIKEFLIRKKRSLAWAAAPAVIIVCALALSNYIMTLKANNTALNSMNPQELELLAELELAQDLDVIENIDWLEDWDIIENIDSTES